MFKLEDLLLIFMPRFCSYGSNVATLMRELLSQPRLHSTCPRLAMTVFVCSALFAVTIIGILDLLIV